MMKKIVVVLMAFLLALNVNFLSLPTASAADQNTQLQPGSYDITAKALNADKDEPSGAAGFIKEAAKLIITENGASLTVTVPKNDMATISGMQIEGKEPTKNGEQWTYQLSSVKELYKAKVQYEVPALNMKHDVPFRFKLEGLDRIPEQEQPEVEKPEADKPEEEKPETDKPENNQKPALKNGHYNIPTAYLHASKDEVSSMGRYLSNPVFVNVKGEQAELTIAVNDHKTVTKLQVAGKNATSTKVDGNTRYETFTVANVQQPITAYVEYEAPYGGSVHKGNATFRVDLDTANAKAAAATDQPGYGIVEPFKLADGLYAINAAFINAKNGENSAMARYLGDKAYLAVKGGKAEVHFLINDNGTVTQLKVNGQESVSEIINGKQTLKAFKMGELTTELKGYAEYQAPFNGSVHHGKAEFDIALDQASVQKVTQLPIENEAPIEDDKENTPKPETPKPEVEKPAVKGFKIDYSIKHATENEASAADKFFVKPGVLLKKDGKNYLQVDINNWSMIGWLKVNGHAVTVVKEDKKADTATVQFQVPTDLNQVVKLSMKVTVPGLYETTHDARLVMDAKSVVEDETGKDYVVQAPSNGNDDLEKPEFGTNNSTTQESGKQNVAGAQKNPQTGDKSNVVLYSILLFGSLTLLVIQYRRRQLNA